MNFASDNWAGASPKVCDALNKAAYGYATAYGGDETTLSVERALGEFFDTEVAVFLVGTGTAANCLALAHFSGPGAVVLCHRSSHIAVDEAGGPEFYGGGTKLVGLSGTNGKIDPAHLGAALEQFPRGAVNQGRPMAVSITQLTECGTAYSPAEIAALSVVARGRDLALHMDGARFANAVAALSCAPADLTWKAGVDVMSLGMTKLGAWCAEAVIFFDRVRADDFVYSRKRAGHLFSKSRFAAAQWQALLDDNHWRELAEHGNAMAARLASGIAGSSAARLAAPRQGNEVFMVAAEPVTQKLRDAGAVFGPWTAVDFADRPGPGEAVSRLVCSFATRNADVDQFLAVLSEAAPTLT